MTDSSAYELGMLFTVNVAGTVTKLRYYKDAADLTVTHTGRLWNADTTAQIGSVVFTGETASGWQEMALASPVAITTGVNYIVSVNVDDNNAGDSKWVRTNNGFPGNSGCFVATQGVIPTSFNTTNYFRDVVFVIGTLSGPVPVDVSALRAFDNVYHNTTGRSILVVLTVACNIGAANGQAYVTPKSDGTTTPTNGAAKVGITNGVDAETGSFQAQFLVISGDNYVVASHTDIGTIAPSYWFETAL